MPAIIVIKRQKGRTPPAAPPAAPLDELEIWSATVDGEPVTRAAASEAGLAAGMPVIQRSHRARLWQRRALQRIAAQRPLRPFRGEFTLTCRTWSRDGTQFCDQALVGELLERAAVIARETQIRGVRLTAAADPDRPRVEIRLARAAGGVA